MKFEIQNQVNEDIIRIKKSINNNLKNTNVFISESEDTARLGVTLKPPVPMSDCKYVFDNSSYVAKCCRILAKDIILNKLTLINDDNPDLDAKVQKIQDNLNNNIVELYYLLIDYYYAGIGAVEYAYGKHRFTLKQIPINTTSIVSFKY